MFKSARAFNQNLSGWNVTKDTKRKDMFKNSGMENESSKQLQPNWDGQR